MLETDLEASRATLNAIKERNKDLGKCNVFINPFYFICLFASWCGEAEPSKCNVIFLAI